MEERLAAIAERIRKGEVSAARDALAALAKGKVARQDAATVASLARQADLPAVSLKVLNPIVRPARRTPQAPGDLEKAEYAAALTNVGASEEASALLHGLDVKKNPQVLLFQAYALMPRWEYAAAIPLLARYVEAPGIGEYQRRLGMVNLCGALVFERRHDEAERILNELRALDPAGEFARLRGYALELSGQNAIFRGEWKEAEGHLAAASAALAKAGSVTEFFARKWLAILKLKRDGAGAANVAGLRAIRAEAVTRRDWETVRACDRFEASARRDRALWAHVYYGTPYAAFRRKLEAEFPEAGAAPAEYAWRIGGEAEGPLIDLAQGTTTASKLPLKAGQVAHRLLAALASDFYRPFRLAPIHHRIYPREFYDPESSPLRVRFALTTLRKWLAGAGVPLAVEEDAGTYRLVATGGCTIALRLAGAAPDQQALYADRLRRAAGGEAFSIRHAMRWLELPERTVSRVLSRALAEGLLTRTGGGSATRYRWAAAAGKVTGRAG